MDEVEEFGPGVVADRVHHALALQHERHVEIGDEDALAGGERRGEQLAFRRDDRREATAGERFSQLFVGRDLFALLVGQPAGGVDDEAP